MNALWLWLVDTPFATASWVDWFDIALLAAVVYRILLAIRGTRAMQSLVGLLGLVGVYAVSRFSGLTTVQWVLDHLFVYLVLAMLILFQDDIRRVLATAGGRLASRVTGTRADSSILEEVIKAAFALSRRRIGALIVLEGDASMDRYIEGSHHLDAMVRHELLQSIFHPAGPMHDGAVLISKNRIANAGVFLPISLSSDINRSFGTRHRAAIGLTEATDAICIVVSEERATVAVVADGQIHPVADVNDLRQTLSEQIGRRQNATEEPEEAVHA